jgi:5-methylcytosine-specific restriction protein A
MPRREFSKKVKRDAFLRSNDYCENSKCGARLTVGKFAYDHDIADGLGGEPTLENCVVLCKSCHDEKTRTNDVPIIAKTKRIQDREQGIRKPSKLRSAGFRKALPQRSASRPINRLNFPKPNPKRHSSGLGPRREGDATWRGQHFCLSQES